MEGTERFSSRWGLILTTMGMAVGAGNIWRFPRVASEHGGGAFMVAWLVALIVWSIPLLIVEFAWGQQSRRGPVGAFVHMAGKRWAWAGGFVVLCCTAIMFYYAVVSGWCLCYFGRSLFLDIDVSSVQRDWDSFAGSGWSVLFLALAMVIALGVVARGIRGGIERACKILVPTLFVLLVVAAVHSLALPGAVQGLQHLFRPNYHMLLDHEVWLQAFSQSAWSTGAGWGLMLVYGSYARRREDTVLTSFITGLGNNAASLVAAMAIVPAVFALLPADQAMLVARSGNEGLGFVWIPRLLLGGDLVGGPLFVVVFFAGLALAALSSLIAMVELGVRTLIDLGLGRRVATVCIGVLGFALGVPSALYMDVFKNQDWVWGLGLLVSGALFAAGSIRHRIAKLRRSINTASDGWRLGPWFDLVVVAVIPLSILAMLVFWFYQASVWDPQGWLNPLAVNSAGTCLLQWGVAILVLLVLNRRLARRVQLARPDKEGGS